MSKTYSVFWTTTAKEDLKGIISYIVRDDNDRAMNIFQQIKQKALTLSFFPLKGRLVPELKFHHIDLYRELIETPWRIIYRIEEKKVFILAVIDSRRNFEDVLLERLLKK